MTEKERTGMTDGDVPWAGVLAPLDTVSVDGRLLVASPTGTVRARPFPLPLMDAHGNVAGRIDQAWVQDGVLRGRGVAAPVLLARGRVPVGVDLDETEFSTEVQIVRLTGWRLVGVTVADPGDAAFPEAYIERATGPDLRTEETY